MKYRIKIHLANDSKIVKNFTSPYYQSGVKRDSITFGLRLITIEAERNRCYVENDIFLNLQNSLYNQMYKCLLFHYAVNGMNAAISKIEIFAKRGNFEYVVCERDFESNNQPLPLFDAPIQFDEQTLELLLEESNDSFDLRMIIAHLMSAVGETDKIKKLECIWRTFERLCTYHRHRPAGERPNILLGLQEMIIELTQHSSRYNITSNLVHSYTIDNLRDYLWHDMISNNYKKGGTHDKYKEYQDFLVTPFHDSRVVQMLFNMRHYRESDLKIHNYYSSIKSGLSSKIAAARQKDIDIVAILCCHYAYYLRNRLFHGQSLVRCSIFDNNGDSMRIEEITKIITSLTVELINNFRNL